MKKQRSYQGSQGRRPEKAEVTYQTLKFAFILFTICMCGYLFLTLWM
jgi:hypothetical protein